MLLYRLMLVTITISSISMLLSIILHLTSNKTLDKDKKTYRVTRILENVGIVTLLIVGVITSLVIIFNIWQ